MNILIKNKNKGARRATATSDYYNPAHIKNNGELTPVGMRQHFILGSNLRKHYKENLKFFPEHYNPEWINVRSTDVNRTLMSAESQLYGIFPLYTGPNISSNISNKLLLPPYKTLVSKHFIKKLKRDALLQNFQSVPIHTVSFDKDYLLKLLILNLKLIEFYKKYNYFFKKIKNFFIC